jgi:hypothetical protein
MKTYSLTLTEDLAEITGFAIMAKIRELKGLTDEISKNQLARLRAAYEALDTCPEKEKEAA